MFTFAYSYGVVSYVVLHGDQHLFVSLSAVTAVGTRPDQARPGYYCSQVTG
jgi:hypothetical protein